MNDLHQSLDNGGDDSSDIRTSLRFDSLTGDQAVLSMIRTAALYSDAVAVGAQTDVVVREVLSDYNIGAPLAERLLKGVLQHGFHQGSLLLHLNREEMTLLPATSTYVQL